MYTISICDDDEDILSALEIYLAQDGYEVIKATNGLEALEAAREHTIHLFLLDIMMPGMDGIRTAVRLREMTNAPILFLSAKAEDTDRILGLNMGGDDYITKPFNPVELLARVRAALRRYARLGGLQDDSQNESVIRTGGLLLDDSRKCVTAEGEEVALTALEYNILRLLMALFMETMARLRDKTLLSTFYLPQFFKRYPVKRPPGFVMFALLAGITLYLIFFSGLRFPGVVISLLLLCALSYFCVFVLSLSKKFEAANEEKLRAERFKAELITNVSHDIRTPLTSIINYVDLLGALPVEHEKFHEYIGVLEKKSARLNTLISDLMEASKAGTGNLPMKLEAIDLSEIIGQIAGEFDEIFTQRDLTLVLRLPEQSVFVQADAGHLWRVLENLFGNAAKYALPGTRVFAEIFERDGQVAFTLKNTSQAPIDLNDGALMEQFIRGDRARNTEGNGLGLYIAKSLVELMGGQLAIEVNGDLFVAEVLWQ